MAKNLRPARSMTLPPNSQPYAMPMQSEAMVGATDDIINLATISATNKA